LPAVALTGNDGPAYAKAPAGTLRMARARRLEGSRRAAATASELKMKTTAMAEHDDSFGGRAKESVTGWWGRSRRFLAEVRNEMARVTWPSRKEVYATTVVVILTSILFGIYLYGIDLMLNALMAWIFRTFGTA
jgi:preprotein translocase subunit SecE